MPWRSPADQPAWARPALLAIAALAAVGYGWGMAGASVESFYGAAARSMSESWHDFIFGAFDPAGTVTVDKLPGALWVQALSLRVSTFTSGRWSCRRWSRECSPCWSCTERSAGSPNLRPA